ncbi:SdpA family antimicrobial peptide system protein [Corynebacterium propinquum]|uniref:SdpA family antimicrobial peptide system protein n=1 Tax=Corynebacterium propinquum TaxID=43769 RepID=A0AAP4F779_9CORY|nr:SdpA family antimicrobial peptide system protein [Corynebacterium propinquum]MDK4234581.1 SdpA family antimicrobial peptide system protein [Corynebacterium propinquum]MDK4239284.1 SdpA family antimicrobial peptide system protein [Corynebacterium propinquum]MDK4251956.1 SdpA family antimicrobial peptide system protein [Corynebacterium propinquum]MDK4258865.1 SdpA family antimicrobial peptide system protein [Corynebacterium propinquum]MDK4282575.1 SdpA family antimicrobial peptide system prot
MSKLIERTALSIWMISVFFLCMVVILSLLPYSPVRSSVSFIEKEKLTAIVPQGWGFFTKDPQEERLNFYKLGSDRKWLADDVANASSTNYFGASRRSRLRGLELAKLLTHVGGPKSENWKTCLSTSRDDCLNSVKDKNPIEVNNDYPIKTICGPSLITQQKPNPWAYSQSGFANGNDIKYLFVKVNCD